MNKELKNWYWSEREALKRQIEEKEEELYTLKQMLGDFETEMEELGILNRVSA